MAAYYYSSIFRNSFPWLAALGSFLALAHSSGFGFLTVLFTSSALILCPVIVSRSKTSVTEHSSGVSCKEDFSEQSLILQQESEVSAPTGKSEEDDTAAQVYDQKKGDSRLGKKVCNSDYFLLSSSDALSDSESLDDHTTSSDDYSENDWIFRENRSHNSSSYCCSDGSISDEDSLIEIALPTGHYLESKTQQEQQHQQQEQQHQSWYGYQKKWTDCSLESHFRQQTLMEMQYEMNEENLIEIDICMGSIKCSRFEIQA